MRKGSHLTEEHKAKLRKPRTEEQKRNCSLAKMGNQYRKGCKNSPESNHKNSLAHKKLGPFEGENNPFYGLHHSEENKQKNREAHLGTKMSDEARRKMSEAHRNNMVWLGKKHTEETKRKQSIVKSGINNPTWNNWSSRFPYSMEWRRELKDRIRQRDHNICQLCHKDIDEIGVGWATHHIDYDKNDCDEENLILLCKRCHGKTNHTNRKLWESLFTTIIENMSPLPLDN
jgi:hypothetical protein